MKTLTLGQQQRLFSKFVGMLLVEIYNRGYEVSLGDAWAMKRSPLEHSPASFHYTRRAIDLNLFKDGVYLVKTESHAQFGEYWKSLHPMCTWGGDFVKPDGNHYSFGEGKR